MSLRRQVDGTTLAFGWTSSNGFVWFWHVLFDGTRFCRCIHSHDYRAAVRERRQRGRDDHRG